jgi:hypothetical protein
MIVYITTEALTWHMLCLPLQDSLSLSCCLQAYHPVEQVQHSFNMPPTTPVQGLILLGYQAHQVVCKRRVHMLTAQLKHLGGLSMQRTRPKLEQYGRGQA